MDKIKKALNRLSPRERQKFKEILLQIDVGDFKDLDLKKLKGRNDIFRVRRGNIRIIFRKKDDSIRILSLERRSSKTYRRR
jgi:mRNA-degrading endonuclease RelE of RelBE toxin-antitoxin system